MPRILMAGENEQGVTLEEAKKAIREIRKEYGGEEPLVIYDENVGRHTPNFKSDFVRQNPMIGWAAAKQMDKAMAEGTELDPIDTFVELMARAEQLRELVGGRKEAEPKGTIGEIIQGVKDLQAMAKEGKVELPWMPEWMTDPAKFIETVETIAGRGKGDETLKTELAELRKSLDDMKEQRYRDQIESQQRQIGALTDKVSELADLVVDLRRPVTGRTEMDLLHEVADKGLEVIKTELPGFRRDIKEAFVGGALPPPKSAEERKERTARLRQAVETDRKIEELGRRIFFGEGREITPQQPETAPPQP